MPCNHKFKNDLQLQYVNWDIKTLFIGTFNPEWPDGNYAEWFYGRTDNNYFWDLLPRMFGDEGLRNSTHREWKAYCQTKKVALTDLLASIGDADIQNETHRQALGKYTDTALAKKFNLQFSNPIVPLLEAHSGIKSVYLTTTNSSKFWQSHWEPVEDYCLMQGIWCQKLMTPSKGARFFMRKESGKSMLDFICKDWSNKWNPNE